MRRRKRFYISFVDFILYHEDEIRAGVQEAKEEYSLYGCSRMDEPTGGQNKISDRTVSAVLHRAKKIKCVVCSMGETVYKPEEWLGVIDTVRQEAQQCQRPEIILNTWEAIYQQDREDYFGRSIWELVDDEKVLTPACDALTILRWIRERIMIHAEEAGIWTRES